MPVFGGLEWNRTLLQPPIRARVYNQTKADGTCMMDDPEIRGTFLQSIYDTSFRHVWNYTCPELLLDKWKVIILCLLVWLLIVSGGETNEDSVAGSDQQTAAAAAAAAAAVVSGSRLTHAVSPALGYYLMPGSGLSVCNLCNCEGSCVMSCLYPPVAFKVQNVVVYLFCVCILHILFQ